MSRTSQPVTALTLGLLLFAFGSPVNAEPISISKPFEYTGFVHPRYGSFNDLRIGIFGSLGPVFPEWLPLFWEHRLTTAQVGSTYSVDAVSDPNFLTLASILTNGEDDLMRLTILVDPGGTGRHQQVRESEFFAGLLPPGYGPDLVGYQVSRINLTVGRLGVTRNPVFGQDIDLAYTFSFEADASAVPEPGTLGLVGAGIAALLARTGRRRRGEIPTDNSLTA
ncbi:MAG: PEP-CTERM sorting domain-containing protein [Acidobacteria bacterium]|nr:PEP-CTERM sorting domain-containing protein [Acidobacteriota bacterium]